ncbi:MAG: restriction endonuclease [Stenotrophomonas nitritireducens]|uniref:restriction endonuclease n=1 Tax=Stenotrophomonas nitritireducens TaxID=83617 RepID=UPI001AD2C776|nr:restriction endonuclease [Stenotrophomonas nitritireducens]MBN8768660.1 restriction endonuclease [Stenotrophomonas sp.]MBN8791928.1 restriction endonuclease [Stenotrophomonas nitritireducens]
MGRGRRNDGLMDAMAALPWPAGIAVGILGFLVLRLGLPAWLGDTGPLAGALSPMSGVLACLWLAACLLGALISAIRSRNRRRLLDTRTDLESLSATGWRNFERLVGEAFRRQGHAVEENHHGGPDGGIDLVLVKNGRRILVQCKQWRSDQVGVAIVREMYGLLVHHHADAVKIVSTGAYTEAAAAFAAGKPIELITGEQLLAMIRAVQPAAPTSASATDARQAASASPTHLTTCPRCGAAMVERRNRQTGAFFMGCSRFPICRGTA